MSATDGTAPIRQLATGFGLLEAARWYPDWGLVFSDVTQGGVYHLPSGAETPRVVVPHRKGIGGLVAHADGGFVVSGRNVAHKRPDGDTVVLLAARPDEVFFNDLGADAEGRVFVGSVAIDPLESPAEPTDSRLGRLYCIEPDGRARVMFDDVEVSNGIGVAPPGSPVYHVDTGRRMVWAFDPADPSGREPFADTSAYPGEPDGLAVGQDGSVWVAMAGGGMVVGWGRSGSVVAEVTVPQAFVTSVCFGGEGLETMYILTGPSGWGGDTGSVYSRLAAGPGLAAPVAQVRVTPGGSGSAGGAMP
jgi:gluconolactonase